MGWPDVTAREHTPEGAIIAPHFRGRGDAKMAVKRKKVLLNPREGLVPMPVVLVGAAHNGRKNVMTAAWVGVACSEPPMISVAIRPQRFTYGLVRASGEFTINLPSEEMLEETDWTGVVSGRKVDKAERFTLVRGRKVKAPIVKECPLNLECVVRHILNLGVHDLFIGEVVAVQADEEVLDRRGGLDTRLIRPVVFVTPTYEYVALGEPLAKFGFSRRSKG